MARFALLVGKHYQDEVREKVINGEKKRVLIRCEYSANDAKRNVVDASRAAVAVTNDKNEIVDFHHPNCDLEVRFNQPGHSEKFRRVPEVEQQAERMNDDDLKRFALAAMAKGLITQADIEKIQGVPVTPQNEQAAKEVAEAAKKGFDTIHTDSGKKPPHPALLNLGKMPKIGLEKLAEDLVNEEEIDEAAIKGCKNEGELRVLLKKTLEAMSK